MSGGGGGGPTQTTNVNTNVPEYAKPYVMNMLGATQNQLFTTTPGKVDPKTGETTPGEITGFKPYTPYSTDPTKYFAGPSGLQTSAYNAASQMQSPTQYQTGTQLATASGLGQLGSAGQANMLGRQGMGIGQMGMLGAMPAFGAGQQYASQVTDPSQVGAYMSPYQQQVTDVAKAAALREAQIADKNMNLASARSGTYGGARQALAQAERERGLLSNLSNIQAQGSQSAYDRAIQNMQYGSNLGLQGISTGLQGTAQGMQGVGQGLQGLGAAQAGYAGAGQAASTLGQLGTSQQAADINAINLQNQLGSQQQQYQQNIINQAIQDYATQQQYPMMQLGFMSNMLRGLPMEASTRQIYQAPPSAISTLGGLGATALGAYGMAGGFKAAKGGMVPGYKQGGSVQAFQGGDLVSQEVNSETVADLVRSLSQYPAERLKQIATTNPSDTVRRVAKELYDRKVGTQQPTQSEGIASAAIPSFDTFNAASGGIVAFAGTTDGSLVDEDELRKKYNIQPGGALDITGNYLGYLQDKGFGQQTPENKAIAANIAEIRKNLGEDYDNRNLYRSIYKGGTKAMQSDSPYWQKGIGAALEGGLDEYVKGEGRKEDLLNKLRQGEIDLAKLTTSERNNLLHYATSAVSADEAAKMRLEGVKHSAALRGIEAGKRQDARDEAARNREETQIREWTKIFIGSGNTNPDEETVNKARKKAEALVRGNPLQLPRS